MTEQDIIVWGHYVLPFQEPHPPPGPHCIESPILYKQVNHEMKEHHVIGHSLQREQFQTSELLEASRVKIVASSCRASWLLSFLSPLW